MTNVEALPALTVIAALIAAALYIASYLSLLRLLRFPRNWVTPSTSELFITGLLVAATVAAVSFSPQGLDFTALAVSLGFFGVMFFTLAAPAIAFQPASFPVEFVAKHADHGGFLLAGLGLGVFAGMAITNVKLLAVLMTAAVIELTWFLHQHWARRQRPIYTLNTHDLAVLETQAKGNLVEFRRRHSISELDLAGGTVRWLGCGKRTPPCPFNLYVNRLGLNTAPCCREHLSELSHFVSTALTEIGVVHWLEGGSLLGAVREGGSLLDWEDDVDISVLLDADMTWKRLASGLAERGATQGYYVDLFENKGLVAISFDAPKPWPFRWQHNRMRGEIRADITVYRQVIQNGIAVLERRSHKGAMPATENGGYGVPPELVLPTTTIPHIGGDFASPNQPEAYLRILYGDFEDVEYTYVNPAAAATRREADVAHKDVKK